MEKIHILWADDEIDLLKPHIIFLREKGYNLYTTTNGADALDIIRNSKLDIVFLDENMPGISGLETLIIIKNEFPNLPVVMITKSEEEHIMEEAIGSKIADYLIKPVNPNQILLCLKKNLEHKRLISEKSSISYQQEFRQISMDKSSRLNFKEWVAVYKKIIYWELELKSSEDEGIREILKMQKNEANNVFAKFYESQYINWLNGKSELKPLMSHTLLKEKILPLLSPNKPVFLIVVDNLRYDQWKVLQPIIENYYHTTTDDIYYSIIPSATQFSRNSFFAGLLPSEIHKKYPQYWVDEDEEGLKNNFEEQLLIEQLKRYGKNLKTSFHKVLNLSYGKKILEWLPNFMKNDLNVIVYNFIDMLSHARTDTDIIRELADDEPAYRSLTLSWFEHSPLLEILKYLSEKDITVVITTDHGSVKVVDPVKVIGDRNTSTNLRYKTGKSLDFEAKKVFEIRNPEAAFLPKINMSSNYIFCRGTDFFAYPNNYNNYVNYYKNTFQHGGISLEEILIPFIVLEPK